MITKARAIKFAAIGLAVGTIAVFATRPLVAMSKEARILLSPSAAASAPAARVAATVDGQQILDTELAPVVAQGVDPALAVDRYINKVVAANLAKSAYPADSAEAAKEAEREVLAQLFVAKRTQELRTAVTDAQVKAYYDANVKAEDYATYKVSAVMAADQKEAETIAQAILAGHASEYDARFKPVTTTNDGYAVAGDFPYGLGGVVRSLKKGEFTRPLTLRSGFTVLRMDDVKTNPRPDLTKVSDGIRNAIVARNLSDQLVAARQAAHVELH